MPDPCRHFKASILDTEVILYTYICIHKKTQVNARSYTILESALINLAVDIDIDNLFTFHECTTTTINRI